MLGFHNVAVGRIYGVFSNENVWAFRPGIKEK